MWHWLQSNTAAITAITSLISVMIWLVYAQLLYQNYRRQRCPKMIISQVKEGTSMAPERVYTAQYNHFYNRRKAARWLRATD